MDISHTYINREMDIPVYMEQPEGIMQGDGKRYVCLLNKSLYGLKQGG